MLSRPVSDIRKDLPSSEVRYLFLVHYLCHFVLPLAATRPPSSTVAIQNRISVGPGVEHPDSYSLHHHKFPSLCQPYTVSMWRPSLDPKSTIYHIFTTRVQLCNLIRTMW